MRKKEKIVISPFWDANLSILTVTIINLIVAVILDLEDLDIGLTLAIFAIYKVYEI